MSGLATTKMSSKGQIIIPEEIRKRLGLKAGSQFVVVGNKDTLILKTITPPSFDEFDELITEAKKQATGVTSDNSKSIPANQGRTFR